MIVFELTDRQAIVTVAGVHHLVHQHHRHAGPKTWCGIRLEPQPETAPRAEHICRACTVAHNDHTNEGHRTS